MRAAPNGNVAITILGGLNRLFDHGEPRALVDDHPLADADAVGPGDPQRTAEYGSGAERGKGLGLGATEHFAGERSGLARAPPLCHSIAQPHTKPRTTPRSPFH